jgi:PilZ domain
MNSSHESNNAIASRRRTGLRQSPRYRINTHLKILRFVKGAKKIIPGYAQKISEGGMAAFIPAQLSMGETLEIEFAFPGFHERLTVHGVVRTTDKFQYGVKFINVDDATMRTIAERSSLLERSGVVRQKPDLL